MPDSIKTESYIFEETSNKTSSANKKQIFILVFCCLIMGVIVYCITPIQGGATDLWGNIVSEKEVRVSVIKTMVLFIPLLSFLIGLIVSLIPYKKKRYVDKYVPFSLTILLVIYSVLFILRVLGSL
ncbi:MAG: hypothetical protein QM594_13065 [Niabella sp.]